MSKKCDTCDQCGEDEISEISTISTSEISEKDEKVNAFVQKFHEHGIGCGLEILKIAKEIHPEAVAIIPLYRSCVVIEQSEDYKKEGIATIHAYSDPHWLGRDITVDTLKSDDFHSKFIIQGKREGPEIYLVDANNYQKMIELMQKGR